MRQPTLAEVVSGAIEARLEDCHVAIPGRVVRYYPERQTVDVAPAVKLPLRAGEQGGDVAYEDLPTWPDVPVAWPSGGGYFCAFPLAADDPVMLVFSDVAMGDYLTTGKESAPIDTRRHSLGYPIAIPGGARPDPKALKDASKDGAIIGKDNAQTQIKITGTDITVGKDATDYVALASKVATELTTIAAALKSAGIAYEPKSVAATLVKAK